MIFRPSPWPYPGPNNRDSRENHTLISKSHQTTSTASTSYPRFTAEILFVASVRLKYNGTPYTSRVLFLPLPPSPTTETPFRDQDKCGISVPDQRARADLRARPRQPNQARPVGVFAFLDGGTCIGVPSTIGLTCACIALCSRYEGYKYI